MEKGVVCADEVAATEATDGAVAFDRIMERIGNDGRFQKRFNYTFNIGMTMFASLIYYNIIMAMNTPKHWCRVPGRDESNLTLDQWRDLTLPRYC